MKNFIIILMTVSIILFNGCAAESEDSTEFLTFSVLYNEQEVSPLKEDWEILTQYAERKNVVMDFSLGDNDDYEKFIELYLEKDNPPDVILKCWPDTVENYAYEGLLLPINEYEDLLPNYKSYISEKNLESDIEALRQRDGNYYILPGYQREIQVQQWIYRKDLFEKHKLGVPATYDELFEALLILKKEYPESTPITASWGGAHLLSMMGAGYGIPAGWSGTRYYNETDDKWEFAPATENYKELYIFLNKCYEAGVLDPEFFSQTNEEFTGKITDGRALVTVTWISSGFDNWNRELEKNGIADGEWEALPVMESTNGIRALPPVNRFRKGLAISAEALQKPYFEEMMEFLDWAIYSDEGVLLAYWGVERLTFERANGTKVFLPDIQSAKNPTAGISMSHEYGFNMIFNLCEDEEFEDFKKPDEIVEFLKRSETNEETLNPAPKLVMESDSIAMVAILMEKLNEYVTLTSNKFITGEIDIGGYWKTYLEQLDKYGLGTLEEIWNTAWNENGN